GQRPEIINSGGSGSVAESAAAPAVTEVTAGSGLYVPGLFDHYRSFTPRPALFFALPAVRRPARGVTTCLSGGYVASGGPRPSVPARLRAVCPGPVRSLPEFHPPSGPVLRPAGGPETRPGVHHLPLWRLRGLRRARAESTARPRRPDRPALSRPGGRGRGPDAGARHRGDRRAGVVASRQGGGALRAVRHAARGGRDCGWARRCGPLAHLPWRREVF